VEILSTLEDTPIDELKIYYSEDNLIQGEKKIWIGVSLAEGRALVAMTCAPDNLIMSETIPPIPPPLGSTGNPNPNRAHMMPNDTINTTTTTDVAQNAVDDNLPQLLDSRGGSHVTNVPEFDKKDFTSWKVRFLVSLTVLNLTF
ncbi:hypothetical protein Tco_1168791, partial [Tanacetum coccineum]